MFKKALFLIYIFTLSLFSANFLEPKEAFVSSVEKEKDDVVFEVKLGKDIYLYDEQIKVFITKPRKMEITKDLNIQEPKSYDEFKIHYGLKIFVPLALVEEKIGKVPFELEFKYQGCSKLGLCYQPMSKTYSFDAFLSKNKEVKNISISLKELIKETDAITAILRDGSIWFILAVFFGFGLLLSLSSCTFPMIPILSSIIVSQSQNNDVQMSVKKGFFLSLVYVLSMSSTYAIAGVLAGLFGANLQTAMQNPTVIVVFAAIFVALAFSMFGYFKLEIPQSIQNKVNNFTNKKSSNGIGGIVIMGFFSALIVGPCIAPPLAGALLYIGQTGDALLGGMVLFVMSLGMGVPLLIIGLGAGKFMPRPGGWMDNVSKVFGVVALGVAIFMLSRIVPEMVSMILWAILFMGSGVYLLKFKSIILKFLALVLFALGIILNLGAGSGATNPLDPLEYLGKQKIEKGLEFQKITSVAQLESIIQNTKKPIMLDFYADWCKFCKEMEHSTFKAKKVKEALSSYTLLQVDTTKNSDEDKKLLKRFNLFAPPGIIFWNAQGKQSSDKIIGYKNSDDFIKHMDRLRF